MKSFLHFKKGAYIGVLVIVAAAVLLEMIAAVQYRYFHHLIANELEVKAETELSMKAITTRHTVKNLEETLTGHIWDLKRDMSNPDSMFNIARWIVKANPSVIGCAIPFKPNYYPSKGRLFEPFAYRVGKKIVSQQIAAEGAHDYTKEGFYPLALKAKKACWVGPYYDSVTKKSTVSYTLPIWDSNRDTIAVFGLDISLDMLGDTLNRRHIYPSSYDLLLTQSGELLAGPDKTPEIEKSIQRIVSIINDSSVVKTQSRSGHSTVAPFKDYDGRKGMVFYHRMRGAPYWQVAVVCYDDEVFDELYTIRKKMFVFSGLGLLILGIIVYLAMRNMFRLQRIGIERERINNELRIASTIQSEMLPGLGTVDLNRDDVDISCSLVSAKEVGGDLYDFFLRDEKLFFCIGDVSGKGVPSAIVMAVIHSLFRTASSHEDNPERIMQTINEVSCQNNRSNMFVTLFVGILDLKSGMLSYCNAGHNPPVIIGQPPLSIISNLPIGLFGDFTYKMQETKLLPGQTLFLYTDGLTEAKNIVHQQFGEDRMNAVLDDCVFKSPHQVLTSMDSCVRTFMQGNGQSDDLTMMAIRFKSAEHC